MVITEHTVNHRVFTYFEHHTLCLYYSDLYIWYNSLMLLSRVAIVMSEMEDIQKKEALENEALEKMIQQSLLANTKVNRMTRKSVQFLHVCFLMPRLLLLL